MPYFAAVFMVPAAVVCGIIALTRGQRALGWIAIVLGGIGLVGVIYTSTQITSIVSNPFGTEALPQSPLAPPPVVTRAEYEQLREGMTYSDACRIVGASGEEMTRSDLAGYTTVMYCWTNSNGSNMNAMFQNGSLVSKAQFGLP
jgi:hypothetical protein